MLKPITASVVLAACSVLLAAPATKPARFENQNAGVRFTCPASWTATRPTSNANLLMNLPLRVGGSKTALAYVVVTPAVEKDPQRELPLIVKRTLDRVRASFKNVESEEAETTIGGTSGTRMIATYEGPVGATRQAFYIVARGEKTYVFSYSAGQAEYDAGVKELERLIESVEWTE